MSSLRINIERISVSLHGVSADVVEQASQGLDAELKRQLGALRLLPLGMRNPGSLSLGPIHIDGATDGATLRSLIAQRLSATLQSELRTDEDNPVTGS